MEPKVFDGVFGRMYSALTPFMKCVHLDVVSRFNLPSDRSISILEIGSGDGSMASLILDSAPLIKTYALMDPSTTQLSIARKKLRRHHDVDIQFLPSTIENSAINEQSYDYIISFASLHHWNDPVIGIRTRMKLCREKVVIIDGIRNQSFSNIHRRIKSLGGGIISTAIYWIGSQDALTHDQLTAITSSFDDVNTANDDDLSYKIEFSKTGHAK